MSKYQKQKLAKTIQYGERGWHVIPVGYNKIPLIKEWEQQGSTDPAQIQEWFKQFPNMNIGIVTGQVSGFFAVDIDIKEEPTGWDSLVKQYDERLKVDVEKQVFAQTASGGLHLLFNCNDMKVKTCTKVLPNVDLRGEGGQIVVDPSSVNINGEWKQYQLKNETLPITDAPEWALDLVHRAGESKSSSTSVKLERILNGLTEGERDDGLFRFALMMRRNNIPEQLANTFMKTACHLCSPDFDEAVALEKVETVYDGRYDNNEQQLKNRREELHEKLQRLKNK